MLNCFQLYGQFFKDYTIKKTKCNKNECDGFRINIFDNKNSIFLFDTSNMSYHHSFNISSTTRIMIIKELISTFENDTSTCCIKVCNYSKTKKENPISSNYSLQIESLYIINLLVFGDKAVYFAPFPVLIKGDTLEVNNDKSEILNVYETYKDWLAIAIKNRFSSFTFPLLNTRYKWYLGKGDIKTIKYSGMAQSKLSLFTGWCKE